LVALMLAGGVFSVQADTLKGAARTEKPKPLVSQCIMASPPLSEIQYQKFIAYLTEEYAPELKAEWEKAFAARRASIKLPGSFEITTDAAEPGGVLSLTLPEEADKTLAEPDSVVVSIAIPPDKINDKTFDEQLKIARRVG